MCKIRCESPNIHGTAQWNMEQIVYLGSRCGVDISPINIEIDGLNTSSSNGLFGNIELENIYDLGLEVKNMTKEGKCMYKAIFSLSEQDAIDNGFTTKTKWAEVMNNVLPDIGRTFSIPIENLCWAAAYHPEEGHPHCHVDFWDSSNKVRDPYIHISKQHTCREIFSKEVFQEERQQMILKKTLSRDLLLDLNKNILDEELDLIFDNSEKIIGRVLEKNISSISYELVNLSLDLPEKGRLVYKLLTPEYKKKVDHVVDEMLKIKSIKKEYDNYMEYNDDISKSYSPTYYEDNQTKIRADHDIRVRMGNQILKSCKDMRLNHYEDVLRFEENNQDLWKSYEENAESYFNVQATEEEIDINKSTKSNSNSHKENDISDSKELDTIYEMEWSKTYKEALDELYNKENPDYNNVIKLLEQEAGKNNVLAIHDLGKIYQNGLGTETDLEKSNAYYSKALDGFEELLEFSSDKKVPYINYRIGKMYERGLGTDIDYDKALFHYNKSAAQENKYGMYSLGSMYLYGNGIDITDDNKQYYHNTALFLFKQSANKDNCYAAYAYSNLAKSEYSKSVKPEEIEKYYAAAYKGFENMYAKQQSDELAYKLGKMCAEGNGTEKNYEKAIDYFSKSVEYNNMNAYYGLGKIYADKEEKFYDLPKAISNLTVAADQEHVYAQLFLGKIYTDETYECIDIKKGITWLDKAATQNNDFAQYKLGKIFMENEEFKDITRSISYFTKSAEQGNQHAQYALGSYYSNTENPDYDIRKAINWLEKSAAQENSYAQLKLGCIYLFGKHKEIPRDTNLGLEYLNKAIDNGNEFAENVLKLYQSKGCLISQCSYNSIMNCFKILTRKNRTAPYNHLQNQTTNNQVLRADRIRKHGHTEKEKEWLDFERERE